MVLLDDFDTLRPRPLSCLAREPNVVEILPFLARLRPYPPPLCQSAHAFPHIRPTLSVFGMLRFVRHLPLHRLNEDHVSALACAFISAPPDADATPPTHHRTGPSSPAATAAVPAPAPSSLPVHPAPLPLVSPASETEADRHPLVSTANMSLGTINTTLC